MAVSSEARDHPARPPGYGELEREAAAYEDASRLVFRVEGDPDRALQALNGLLTADVLATGKEAAFPTLILTPKGKVLADAVLVRAGGALLLDVPHAAWPDLEEHFTRYLPPRFARLEPSELRTVRIRGPLALQRERTDLELARLDGPEYTAQEGSRWSATPFREGVAARPPEGYDLYLRAGAVHGLDLPEASEAAWEIFRVEHGIPVYGRDVSLENLPQETGLVPERVSFTKGCYTGQEVLARIHYRGKVNRQLRGLRATGPSATPPLHPGDELEADGRVVGQVTSAVESPIHGWIGLGYLRREVEPGDDVVVRREGRETDSPFHATVDSLPFVAR